MNWPAVLRTLRPVAPLLVVNTFAVLGQVFYGFDHYSPAGWPIEARLAVAIGAAVGLESIAWYVSWHAHDALMLKATSTAARMRRASYLIAAGVAAINYLHFSPDLVPTGAAVVFAGFSLSSPWLWGLHTRRAHRVQLLREGQADSTGAVFSAERWRAFPVRTWKARRWSIDHGVTDPRAAWVGYNGTLLTTAPPVAPLAAPVPEAEEPEQPRPALKSVPARKTTRTVNATLPGDHQAKVAAIKQAGGGRGEVVKQLGVTPAQARTLLDRLKVGLP